MTQNSQKAWVQAIVISFAAGTASSLLCIVLQPQSIFGVFLFLLSPLPLIIAGLSYHALVAALGALIGCLFLSLVQSTSLAIAYGFMVGLPSWLVCAAALKMPSSSQILVFKTTGLILFYIAVYVTVVVVGAALWIDPDYKSMQSSLQSAFADALSLASKSEYGMSMKFPESADLAQMGRIYARIMPVLASLPLFIMLVASAYFGAKVSLVSGRLQRSWPDFRRLQLPAITLPVYGLAIGLIMAPDYFGLVGEILTLVLTLCLMLQGLAVLHFKVTQYPNWRWLLGTSWMLILVFGVFGLGFSLLGLADLIFDFRKLRLSNTTLPTS